MECYLNRPETSGIAQREGITRTQVGVRLAVEEHPCALYVFGNAPTALMELCGLMRAGKARPCGVVAAPVGFVHVCEQAYAEALPRCSQDYSGGEEGWQQPCRHSRELDSLLAGCP